jgi:hypothetical protein
MAVHDVLNEPGKPPILATHGQFEVGVPGNIANAEITPQAAMAAQALRNSFIEVSRRVRRWRRFLPLSYPEIVAEW